ncbi:MAG: sigma-70 family RNA polymerase sigma factor [Bryobacteraceae bacterium]|nr:sigma-70 family RNA polymerase sigma factor [Bryobacteraceae bacterium]
MEAVRRAPDPAAWDLNPFFSSFYPQLRSIARARLRAGRDSLLDTTSLVHEFYIRLVESGNIRAEEWPRFLSYASRAMRNIIVDSLRRRGAARHGGDLRQTGTNQAASHLPASGEEEILAVHQALEQLEAIDSRSAQIVEMRYFGGMTETEIATALGLTERTVRRGWQKARLLLAQALG